MVSDFGQNSATRDGLSAYCLPCTRVKSRDYYKDRRERQGLLVRSRETLPEGVKRCSECRATKALNEFHKHRTQPDGLNTYCKDCRRRQNAENHLRRTYGLSVRDLAALVESQGGTCAICETRPAEHVDHDHVTGRVRGVLCFPCNVALGHLKDDVALFRKAIGYLERTRED